MGNLGLVSAILGKILGAFSFLVVVASGQCGFLRATAGARGRLSRRRPSCFPSGLAGWLAGGGA